MTSQSILTALTDHAINDKSNNRNINTDSDRKNTLSFGTGHENNASSGLVEVCFVNHQNNNDSKKKSRFKDNKKNKAAQNKAILTSEENVLSATTEKITMPHTSLVWQYAIRCPNSNYSTCCLCPDNKQISTHNGSTSTLRKHLIAKHHIYELALPNSKRTSTASSISVNRKKELHNLAIVCIIRDGRTFSDLQKPGMKKFLQELIPGYDPPNRYVVARRLKQLHMFYHQKLIDDLTLIDHISITIDFWSNRQMRCFFVITGHYFETNSFHLKSTVLNFSTFDNQHISNEITRILQAKLKELNILHKVVRVTADGANNVVRAIGDMNLNLKRIWCVAHRLHLTIINAFGFWIAKKEDTEQNILMEEQDLNYEPNDQVEEMTIGERFANEDEIDEMNMDITNDLELNNHESMGASELNDEAELLSDIIEEEIMDNWTADVVESKSDNVYDQDMIISLVKKCRGLVKIIKRSTIITLFFDNERKKLKIKRNLCYDVKSRWNSTYCMIDSFLVLRELIEKLFNFKHHLHIKLEELRKLTDFELTSDNWNLLSTLHSILKPFFHATKALSGRQYPSIGIGFYLLVRLKMFLQQHERKENLMVKRLKHLLLEKFMYYFESDDDQLQLLKLHSYFDPAGFSTLIDSEKHSIEQIIKRMIIDKVSDSSGSVSITLPISTTTTNSSNKSVLNENSNKSAMDIFNESIGENIFVENRHDVNRRATFIDDIQNYRKYVSQFNLKYKPDTASSTLFWQTYGQNFPALAKLAKQMLSTPATSVPSESCFSVASFLGRKERSRLTGENLSSSVFLKDKIDF
ncbi:unnamed protein product [Rotaria sp. Silwood1]|nr:unnamed protein product [Rotaria sp. Silwood1]